MPLKIFPPCKTNGESVFVNIRTIFKMFRRKQTGDFSWRADGMVNVFEIKLIRQYHQADV